MLKQLKSNKTVELDGIKDITPIRFYEYPDVYTSFWHEFSIIYENGYIMYLSYDTKQSAEIDRKYLEELLNF